ncbi:MAG: TatD family hydrolase [bacterium JZ-2024 1]
MIYTECFIMWDAHIHLDDEQFSKDVGAVIRRSQEKGIKGVVNPSVSLLSAQKIAILSEQYPGFIYFALGFHPHSAGEVSAQDLREMEQRIREWKPVGIGETGLDWRKTYSAQEEQISVFEKHIEWAEEFSLPLIVHMRESEEALLEILGKHQKVVGMIHSYSGTVRSAEKFLEMGWYLSFSGVVTYPTAKEMKEVVKIVPDEKILIETDAPYLAPQKFRGKRCLPEMIFETLRCVAELRGEEPEILKRKVCRNLFRLFSFNRGEAE